MDPLDRLADTVIRPELPAADLMWAAISATALIQLGTERAGAGTVGVAHFAELSDRLFSAAGEGMREAGLTMDEIEEVLAEVKKQATIFQLPDR